ncbi:Serine/threonine-protein kinase [Hypoxylon texense]
MANFSGAYPSYWRAPSGSYAQDPIYNADLARELEEHRRIVDAIEHAKYANGFGSNMTLPDYGKDDRAYAYPNEQGAFKDQLNSLDSSRNEYFNESSYTDEVVPTHHQAVLNGNSGHDYPSEGSHQFLGHPMGITLLPPTYTVPAAIAPADGPPNGADFAASSSSGGIQSVPAGVAHPQHSSPVSEAGGNKGNSGNSGSRKWPSKLAVQETPATVDPKCIQNTPPVSVRRPLRIKIVRRPKSASAAIRSNNEVAANTNTNTNTTLPQSAPATQTTSYAHSAPVVQPTHTVQPTPAAQPASVAQPNSAAYLAPAVQPTPVAQCPSHEATSNLARGRQVKRGRRKRDHDDDDDEYVPGMSGGEKSPSPPKRRRKTKAQAKSQSSTSSSRHNPPTVVHDQDSSSQVQEYADLED